MAPDGLRQCIAEGAGHWTPVEPGWPHHRPPYVLNSTVPIVSRYTFNSARKCELDAAHNSAYTWIPSCSSRHGWLHNRSLEVLSGQFCNSYEGSLVLVVGDSTNGQWFLSIATILGMDAPSRFTSAPRACDRSLNVSAFDAYSHSEVKVCPGGRTTLKYIRNGHAVVNETKETAARASGAACLQEPASNDMPWLYAAEKADLLILNRGAWAPHDEATFRSEVDTTLAALATLRNRPRVVWRGTSAGIPSCWTLPDPLASPYAFDFNAKPSLAAEKSITTFHYHLFEPLNAIARQAVERAGHAFLDTYRQTSFRPGGHYPQRKDCLHWCLPGPPDEWTRLLLLLLLHTTERPLAPAHRG